MRLKNKLVEIIPVLASYFFEKNINEEKYKHLLAVLENVNKESVNVKDIIDLGEILSKFSNDKISTETLLDLSFDAVDSYYKEEHDDDSKSIEFSEMLGEIEKILTLESEKGTLENQLLFYTKVEKQLSSYGFYSFTTKFILKAVELKISLDDECFYNFLKVYSKKCFDNYADGEISIADYFSFDLEALLFKTCDGDNIIKFLSELRNFVLSSKKPTEKKYSYFFGFAYWMLNTVPLTYSILTTEHYIEELLNVETSCFLSFERAFDELSKISNKDCFVSDLVQNAIGRIFNFGIKSIGFKIFTKILEISPNYKFLELIGERVYNEVTFEVLVDTHYDFESSRDLYLFIKQYFNNLNLSFYFKTIFENAKDLETLYPNDEKVFLSCCADIAFYDMGNFQLTYEVLQTIYSLDSENKKLIDLLKKYFSDEKDVKNKETLFNFILDHNELINSWLAEYFGEEEDQLNVIRYLIYKKLNLVIDEDSQFKFYKSFITFILNGSLTSLIENFSFIFNKDFVEAYNNVDCVKAVGERIRNSPEEEYLYFFDDYTIYGWLKENFDDDSLYDIVKGTSVAERIREDYW